MSPSGSLRTASLLLFVLLPARLGAQSPAGTQPAATGWELTGFPAANYDSDEGFGYGAVLAAYDYGPGGMAPYRMSFLPTVFFTSKGRMDLTLFFDAPHLLSGGWRVDAYLGYEKLIATPFYGVGNSTQYDPELEEEGNPYYYRYGRTRRALEVNLQHGLGDLPLRALVGGKWSSFSLDSTPKDEGSTLLQLRGADVLDPPGSVNSVRVGLIWDTRDRESGPTRGVWTEALVEASLDFLGSETSFTRWTFSDRRYRALGDRIVFANRILLQNVTGNPPFYVLSYWQSSFGGHEALGGASSVRGLLKNRYIGEGIFLWNPELRWRLFEFQVLGRSGYVAMTGFVDSGRVWEDGVDLGSIFSDLHHGVGGGLRLGLGPNFVLALDMASSAEAGLQTYTGLGYMF